MISALYFHPALTYIHCSAGLITNIILFSIHRLSYDDAASACLAALKVGPTLNSKRTFLISDGNPTTRKGICESALKCSSYAQYSMPRFLGPDDGLKGKIYHGSMSNELLQWKPKYPSFDSFMDSFI